MKLIFGLGNPGKEYELTRHNIGFMFLDYVTNNAEFTLNKRFNSLEYKCNFFGNDVIFVKPLSYMNLSGEVVSKYINYYKVKLDDILIIQDDLDMEVGKYKLLFNHGDGGHNGIKSIFQFVKSREFLRLKIGISKANIDTKEYVLGKFTKDEINKLDDVLANFNEFLVDFVSLNRDLLMGKYNCK